MFGVASDFLQNCTYFDDNPAFVTVHLANGQTESYWLAGDEVYVDAHILKWKPWANLLGLHTAYELDRIAGRYHRIEDERVRPRMVYQLTTDRLVAVFARFGVITAGWSQWSMRNMDRRLSSPHANASRSNFASPPPGYYFVH